MLLLVMVKHIAIFNIFIPTFLHCVLQTIGEVEYDDRNKGKSIIEVIILRQENEVKSWFIRSCTFLTPVTGINIDSTAELPDRAFIDVFKETITKMQGQSLKQIR